MLSPMTQMLLWGLLIGFFLGIIWLGLVLGVAQRLKRVSPPTAAERTWTHIEADGKSRRFYNRAAKTEQDLDPHKGSWYDEDGHLHLS